MAHNNRQYLRLRLFRARRSSLFVGYRRRWDGYCFCSLPAHNIFRIRWRNSRHGVRRGVFCDDYRRRAQLRLRARLSRNAEKAKPHCGGMYCVVRPHPDNGGGRRGASERLRSDCLHVRRADRRAVGMSVFRPHEGRRGSALFLSDGMRVGCGIFAVQLRPFGL